MSTIWAVTKGSMRDGESDRAARARGGSLLSADATEEGFQHLHHARKLRQKTKSEPGASSYERHGRSQYILQKFQRMRGGVDCVCVPAFSFLMEVFISHARKQFHMLLPRGAQFADVTSGSELAPNLNAYC
ncbi:uncharacterized protein MYCFIDRAFT_174199 [Pseudocercospora fijiensis CIRAD86]|uniref:Uncharacterized protein n=1 Tax=Pseudocercospora fijiensis (strain CIRAD86) TaxID=383855 RepID=M2ZUE6_PSEFD|nr:uncharacterized protein MYCFIDRAFT_174199 [Pseudocercospora fijiensis CIRAD86]EME82629.1 hypothetical protein MYCFIDRAFT_174199 [Pseudocercospora fijiensis CIRAD86]